MALIARLQFGNNESKVYSSEYLVADCHCVLFDLMVANGGDLTASSELLFEDAYCFSLAEDYHIDSSNRRYLKLSLMAERVIVDGVVYKNTPK